MRRRDDRREARGDQDRRNRMLFKQAMDEAGLQMPRGGFAKSWRTLKVIVEETGYPAIIRRRLLWRHGRR